MTIKEAQTKLGVSRTTIKTMMRDGRLTFTKTPVTAGNRFLPSVTITGGPALDALTARVTALADAACPVSDVRPAPEYDDHPTHTAPQPTDREQKDRTFAERYLAGEVPDSLGNFYCGDSSRSMLGPTDLSSGPAVDIQSHMDPALLATSGSAERHGFDKGMSDEQHREALAGWRRQHGAPSMSEQRAAMDRARANINASFSFARRRSL